MMRQARRALDLRSAANEVAPSHGDADAALKAASGDECTADFAVSGVSRPILSVAALVDRGFSVACEPNGAAMRVRDTTARTSGLARAAPTSLWLAPGEALYIPPYTFHRVQVGLSQATPEICRDLP